MARVLSRADIAALTLEVRRLRPDVSLPVRQHPGDAGLDLCLDEDVELGPGERKLAGTGLAVAIPEGHAGLVTPRSGTASGLGVSLANTPGVVDSGYRGELKLALINLDRTQPVRLERGQRVAQLLVVPVACFEPVEVEELPPSERGRGGFGSTGT